MRVTRNPQMELGAVRIQDIEPDFKSRDGISALLIGLQQPRSDEIFREWLFAPLEEHMLPNEHRTVGRPGMEMWQTLAPDHDAHLPIARAMAEEMHNPVDCAVAGPTAFGTTGANGTEGIVLGNSRALFHAKCRSRDRTAAIATTPAACSKRHPSWRRRHSPTSCRTAHSCR